MMAPPSLWARQRDQTSRTTDHGVSDQTWRSGSITHDWVLGPGYPWRYYYQEHPGYLQCPSIIRASQTTFILAPKDGKVSALPTFKNVSSKSKEPARTDPIRPRVWPSLLKLSRSVKLEYQSYLPKGVQRVT